MFMFKELEEVAAAIEESGGGVVGEAKQRMAGRILDHKKVNRRKLMKVETLSVHIILQ